MTESELLQALYASTQTIISLYGMFVTIASAYIAGLFLFLKDAPLLLRLLAFMLLSVSLAFLGGAAAVQQGAQEAIFEAWLKLPNPAIAASVIISPFPVKEIYGVSVRAIGVALGWAAAASVYVALAFMTFLYDWKSR
ncbi:MAG: hypothetical protein NW223_12780 [Hyphomicrobiaceae bacterium]|nr:hypothetical protein [Hyphomicrobiaceae bacterium]